MRISIVHSRYLSGAASGENVVVEDEAKLLTRGGHHVEVWQPRPTRVTGIGLVRTGLDAIWSRDAVAQVRRMVRQTGAEVVHFHNLFPTLSPAVLRVPTEEGAAAVMTLHNYRLMCLPSTFLRDGRICEDCAGRLPWPGVVHRCYRDSLPGSVALAASLSLHRKSRTFDRVALYLPVSEFVRTKYIEAGFAPERLRAKSNFAWPTRKREGPGDHFVYLGRLSTEKGVRTLVEAWKRMTAKLVVVGDGPDAGSLRSVAPRTIEFAGLVHHAKVADILRGARAILVPSLWYEAQPRVILEAYATGVPVIASRIGGLPDLVVDGESGLLVPPGDPGAWAEAAGRLLDDSEADRLGEGAHRLWKDRYSPERGLKDLNDAYRFALSRR
jgi:glycosyltransferase involved in cell wall biosynthesis